MPEEKLKATYAYIHVEDISLAHVVALQKNEAAGERIIVASGTLCIVFNTQEVLTSLKYSRINDVSNH
jgi:UDP-glucose 4-epimerase